MKMLRWLRWLLMTFGLSIALVQPALAELQPIVTRDLHHDISPRVLDLKPGRLEGSYVDEEAEAVRPAIPDMPNPSLADPSQQTEQGTLLPIGVWYNFDGLG